MRKGARSPWITLDVPYDGVYLQGRAAREPSRSIPSPGYDDSSWAQGPGGFGSQVPPGSTLGIGTFVVRLIEGDGSAAPRLPWL